MKPQSEELTMKLYRHGQTHDSTVLFLIRRCGSKNRPPSVRV